MAVAVVVTVVTGVDYVVKAWRLVRTSPSARRARRAARAGRGVVPAGAPMSASARSSSPCPRGLARSETLAVAESLTGGALAAALVDVPGVSAVFRGGVVAYATDLKHALLGVDAGLLAREGAVHPEVARQMADGVRRAAGGDLGAGDDGRGGARSAGRPDARARVYVAVTGPAGRAGASAAAARGPGRGAGGGRRGALCCCSGRPRAGSAEGVAGRRSGTAGAPPSVRAV